MIEERLIHLSFNHQGPYHLGQCSYNLYYLGLCPHRPKLLSEFVVCEDTDHGGKWKNYNSITSS